MSSIYLFKNILQSFQREKSYFISSNKFRLKGIKLGPLPKNKEIKIKICNFVDSNFKLPSKYLKESKISNLGENLFYEQIFNPELIIYSDIKITIKKDINFYVWVNLWYSTWEMIKNFYDKEERKISNEDKSIKNIDIENIFNISESKSNFNKNKQIHNFFKFG